MSFLRWMETYGSSADVVSLRHRGLLSGTEHQVSGSEPTFERPLSFIIERKGICVRSYHSSTAGIKCEMELKRCTVKGCPVCSRPSYEGMRVCEFSLVGPWTLWDFTVETRKPGEEYKTFFEAIVDTTLQHALDAAGRDKLVHVLSDLWPTYVGSYFGRTNAGVLRPEQTTS
jgi:hypothetical protein